MATATAARAAHMSLQNSPAGGAVLTATVPRDMTEKDFAVLGRSILGLINKHTGCNCMSGRISVVLESQFNEVINVELRG